MNEQDVTVMKCGCVIELINGKHMITQYCLEHEEQDEDELMEDPKHYKIRKFNDRESI